MFGNGRLHPTLKARMNGLLSCRQSRTRPILTTRLKEAHSSAPKTIVPVTAPHLVNHKRRIFQLITLGLGLLAKSRTIKRGHISIRL